MKNLMLFGSFGWSEVLIIALLLFVVFFFGLWIWTVKKFTKKDR